MEIFCEKLMLSLTGMPLYRNRTPTELRNDIANTESNYFLKYLLYVVFPIITTSCSKCKKFQVMAWIFVFSGYQNQQCLGLGDTKASSVANPNCLAPLRRAWSTLLTPSLQILADRRCPLPITCS